jgi:hypothetical protein
MHRRADESVTVIGAKGMKNETGVKTNDQSRGDRRAVCRGKRYRRALHNRGTRGRGDGKKRVGGWKERNARNHTGPKHRLRVLELNLPCVEAGRAGDEDGSPAEGELDVCVLVILGEELGSGEVLQIHGIMVSWAVFDIDRREGWICRWSQVERRREEERR